jgi:hypothetical protein
MYSYDHDLEEFVSIGLGTVNAEGSVIKSNQGVGVIKAGWHCGSQPGGAGCAAGLKECQKCEGNCVITTLPNVPDVKGDCKSPKDCKSSQPNDGDVPPDNTSQGDCKKSGCENGSSKAINDDSDKPSGDANICKTCQNGNIANKPDGEANICEDCLLGVAVKKPLGPPTSYSYTYGAPSDVANKINSALGELKTVGVIASVNLLQVKGTITESDCCDPDKGKGKKLQGTVNGNFGGFSVKGKIWPPGPIPTFGPKEIDVFGLASLTVKAEFVGGIFLGLAGNISGEVGYKKDDCSKDPNNQAGCVYANLNTTLTPSFSAEIGASGSLTTDCAFCVKETISLSGSVILGQLSWPLNLSTVTYNQASCSAGVAGGFFEATPATFKTSVKFSGSYSDSSGTKVTVDKTLDFLSCTISLSSGVTCVY